MPREYKCPNCLKWTNRQGFEDDKCEKCGALLEEKRILIRKEKEILKLKGEEENILNIRDTDSKRKVLAKKGTFIFLALVFIIFILFIATHA